MLNRNPGLRDICHSITGGALVAQGNTDPFPLLLILTSNRILDAVRSSEGSGRDFLLDH